MIYRVLISFFALLISYSVYADMGSSGLSLTNNPNVSNATGNLPAANLPGSGTWTSTSITPATSTNSYALQHSTTVTPGSAVTAAVNEAWNDDLKLTGNWGNVTSNGDTTGPDVGITFDALTGNVSTPTTGFQAHVYGNSGANGRTITSTDLFKAHFDWNTTATLSSLVLYDTTITTVGGTVSNMTIFKCADYSSFNSNMGIRNCLTNSDASSSINNAGPLYENRGIINRGTKFTVSGCTAGTTIGGATAGTFVSGTTGTCTVVITMAGAMGMTADNGWACAVSNQTTANLIRQTASNTTTATVAGVTVANDVISFFCEGF